MTFLSYVRYIYIFFVTFEAISVASRTLSAASRTFSGTSAALPKDLKYPSPSFVMIIFRRTRLIPNHYQTDRRFNFDKASGAEETALATVAFLPIENTFLLVCTLNVTSHRKYIFVNILFPLPTMSGDDVLLVEERRMR